MSKGVVAWRVVSATKGLEFVDNVDNVDARFKLVADEASTYVDTLYRY